MKYAEGPLKCNGTTAVTWSPPRSENAEAMRWVLDVVERYLNDRGKPIEFVDMSIIQDGIQFSITWDGVEI